MTTAAKPNPIPATYRRVTPCLIVQGAAKALDFYAEVFGATERMRFPGPDGTVAHAEIQIGDSVVIVEDEDPQRGTTAPTGRWPSRHPGRPVHLRRGRRRRGGAGCGTRRDDAARPAALVLR
jgi:PhnB protein